MIHRRACSSRRCRSSLATGQTEYDWRKCEAKINAAAAISSPRLTGSTFISFMFVRSMKMRLPLIVTHGWPGSIIEQLKIIDPLTDPTAHGASAADAFDVVIPSMPGYGFSGKPTTTGWDPAHIARAWVVLMKRLGYTKFVAQGGDWGEAVTELMGVQRLRNCSAFTPTCLASFRPTLTRRCFRGAGASGSLRRRKGRVREWTVRLSEGNRLRLPDGAAPADALRNC